MLTSLSAFAARNTGREEGSAMSASAESAKMRASSPGFSSSKTLVKSATAPRHLSDPRVVMISLRTRSMLRSSIGRRRSPADGSPIFLSARTASKRTSGLRSRATAPSSSGIAGSARTIPKPRLVCRRILSSESLMRARRAVTTEGSTGTSGSTTASEYSSEKLIRFPSFARAAVGPVARGRCRFTKA